MSRIYLDHNASAPLCASARDTLSHHVTANLHGNPSARHGEGVVARCILDSARRDVASALGADPSDIVFTSGGSEANNFAIKGSFFALAASGRHIITQASEHASVLRPLAFLERLGARVTVLGVDSEGLVDPDAVRQAITRETILITVMHANNETGTIQPIADIARIARDHGVRFHSDGAQTFGKMTVPVGVSGPDLLTIAGHKFGAPRGVGALYVKGGAVLEPLIHGAGHEAGRRAGTEAVALAASLAATCREGEWLRASNTLRAHRDYFHGMLVEQFGRKIALNGHLVERLANTLNVSFLGYDGADIVARLTGIAASTGSACHESGGTASPVLRAMGLTQDRLRGAVRFSLGPQTSRNELDQVLAQFQLMRRSKI